MLTYSGKECSRQSEQVVQTSYDGKEFGILEELMGEGKSVS